MIENKNKYDYDLLVIGCGPAGQRAAIQAAKINKKVAIVDKLDFVGGNCVNNSTIPSKSFKESVVFLSGYRQKSIYGGAYRVKSEIEMSDLTFRCSRIIKSEIDVIRDQLLRNKVDIIQGHAKILSDHSIAIQNIDSVVTKTANKILISVGAKPFRPDNIEFNGKDIFDSDDILLMDKLPRDLTIVGGGVIGTEYGSMFANLGVEVTIVDARERLLGFVDREISDNLQYHLRNLGVTLRLGEEVAKCTIRDDNQVVTELKSGKVIVSNTAFISAGRVSAVENLGLDSVGIEADGRGKIKVNKHYQTSVPNIYAAGDVIGFPALAATSSDQGRLVSVHAFDISEKRVEVPLPIGIYSIPEISYVGKTEQELTNENIPYETGIARYKEIVRGQILGDLQGLLKILFHRETHKILGVHIIGEAATELIHIGQAVIGLGGDLNYLKDTVFNYPTLAECYKVAAYDGYNKVRV